MYQPQLYISSSAGHLTLNNAIIHKPEAENEIAVVTSSRTWEFKFDSPEECEAWMSCFKEMVQKLSGTQMKTRGTLKRGSFLSAVPQDKCLDEHSLLAQHTNTVPHNVPGFISPETLAKVNAHRCESVDDIKELSVICCTWNLAEQLPELDHLSFVREFRHADIVCCGVQECQNVLHMSTSRQLDPVDVWQAMFTAALGPKFSVVGTKWMGGIHIVVFAKYDILYLISNVTVGVVACGIGNVMHNKGAAAVSFDFKETSFCFISAHFQANRSRVLERNDDFWRIDTHMPAVLGNLGFEESAAINPTRGDVHKKGPEMMRRVSMVFGLGADIEDRSRSLLAERFDHVFWVGDFNYRLELEVDETKRMLSFAQQLNELSSSVALKPSISDAVIVTKEEDKNEEKKADENARALRMEIALVGTIQICEGNEDEHDEDDKALDDDDDDDYNEDEELNKGASRPQESLDDFIMRTGLRSSREILDKLFSVDQLNIHRGQGKVFVGYEEPSITFRPSYKFDPFSETYDTGKKNRGAAWCDRILYSKPKSENISLVSYRCAHGVYHSDHRAVIGEFKVSKL